MGSRRLSGGDLDGANDDSLPAAALCTYGPAGRPVFEPAGQASHRESLEWADRRRPATSHAGGAVSDFAQGCPEGRRAARPALCVNQAQAPSGGEAGFGAAVAGSFRFTGDLGRPLSLVGPLRS